MAYQRVRATGAFYDWPDTRAPIPAASFEQWDQAVYDLKNVVRYSDDFTGATAGAKIANAIASLASGGRVIVTSSGSVVSELDIPANVTVEGLPGVTLTKAFSGTMIRFIGDNAALRGLTIDGAQASGFTGACVALSVAGGADRGTVENCVIKNANTYGVYLNLATRSVVRNCSFSGNQTDAVFGEKNSVKTLVADNWITHQGSQPAVAFHSTTVGLNVNNTRIVGNYIESNIFCIEINASSGDTPNYFSIADNTCVQLGTGTIYGGISVAGTSHGSIVGNTFDVNGQTAITAGIEVSDSTFVTVTGNAIKGGTTLYKAIILDHASYCTVSGNTVDGFLNSPSTNAGFGIRVYAQVLGDATDNTISGNTVVCPATGAIRAISVQANHATANADRNVVSGNVVRGNGVVGQYGVSLENLVAGTVDKSIVIGNAATNCGTSIFQSGDTNSLVPAGTNQS